MEAHRETRVRSWIAEHKALASELRFAIEGGSTGLTVESLRETRACELGRALALGRLGLPEAGRAAELHAAFHESAAAALGLASAGRVEAARAAIAYAGEVTLAGSGLARGLLELQRAAERSGRPLDALPAASDDDLHPTLGLLVASLAQEPSGLQVWGDPVAQVVTVLLPLGALERELLDGRDGDLGRLRDTLQAVRYSPGGGRLTLQLVSLGHGSGAPLQAQVRVAA